MQFAVGVEVKHRRRVEPWQHPDHQHHAARPQCMAHAQFVPDIGVGRGQVGQHQIGSQQFLEHVDPNVTGALLLIGPEHLEAGVQQGRPQQVGQHPVEADRALAVRSGFGTEGHRDESMRLHGVASVGSQGV